MKLTKRYLTPYGRLVTLAVMGALIVLLALVGLFGAAYGQTAVERAKGKGDPCRQTSQQRERIIQEQQEEQRRKEHKAIMDELERLRLWGR